MSNLHSIMDMLETIFPKDARRRPITKKDPPPGGKLCWLCHTIKHQSQFEFGARFPGEVCQSCADIEVC